MKRIAALFFSLAVLATPAAAQEQEEDDKTFLENFLEENLSSEGMDVTVNGFTGALSSEAQMRELTFSDDEGVWLRLEGLTLSWDRSALLQRRVEIRTLAAEEIELSRLPGGEGGGPSPEASDFTLPELPVAIDIDRLETPNLILGADVLGERITMQLEGAGNLEGGEGTANLSLERTDGQRGELKLEGSYSNETRVLALDLSLIEGPGGIAATLADLPGEPAINLSVVGEDKLDDYTADIMLSTDGETRLAGQVQVTAEQVEQGGETRSQTGLEVNLSGDLRPLFEEEYRPFFGGESVLHATGRRFANGSTRISNLFLRTDALELSGDATINARGWPERAHIEGRIASQSGTPVTLPIAGPPAQIDSADLLFDYDRLRGQGWRAELEVDGFTRDGAALDALTATGSGQLEPGGGDRTPSVTGDVELAADGIDPGDPALAEAIGERLDGTLSFTKLEGGPFRFTDLALRGEDYGLTGDLTLSTDVEKLDLIAGLDLGLDAERLSRFAALTGQDLTGAARLDIQGEVAVPGGPFDLEIEGRTSDLAIGIERVDALLAGESRLSILADRNEARTQISRFSVAGPGIAATASGELRSDGSRLAAQIDIPDASRLDPRLEGGIAILGDAVQVDGAWTVEAKANGPGGLSADVSGTGRLTDAGLGPVTAQVVAQIDNLAPYSGLAGRDLAGALEVALRADGNFETGAFSASGTGRGQDLAFSAGEADQLFAGASEMDFNLRRDERGTLFIEAFDLSTPLLRVDAEGSSEGSESRVTFNARLADTGIFVPELSGPFTARGDAVLTGDAYRVDVSGQGPGGVTVNAAGTVAGNGERADLSIDGSVPLTLANAFTGANQLDGIADFDLNLNGPLALESLSGRVSSANARISIPALRIALDPIQANIRLGNGRARVEAAANVSSGGRIEVAGPITLAQPYDADLTVRMQNVGLTDPALYDTQVSGQLTVIGPLTGGARIAGRVEAGAVEIRIPSSGFGVAGGLEGLTHVNEPAAVRATRARAGKTGEASAGGGGPAYPLDIVVSAPNQVFIRGRGLDAELGGQLRLTGTTADIRPQGGFSLIRGRLSLLGNRIELTQARATLEGSFDPYIAVTAQTTVDETAIQIRIQGQATEPDITFTSSPDLPEDEILARLVFGRSLSEISPLQALRMANGVATLTGGSGGGVIGNLRDGFGLADLDVGTNDSGAIAVRAGTYISENVYTGVEVGADGEAEVNINLDLTKNLTARGSVSTDGDTSLGIYFERDY
ncbi:hypothetical protein GQE99_15235 [Maritimibacter sp. DP07]|uniref:Translocation and assembly module TamB C-terminal domain-containing protein n=1 Tax=Maritimibacter harenae TaxID=2606218 RepID=A0A845MB75_9RHOB|nr:translocation/assembly module TamB domain-containing protein [Maritimibacter harenae]MZR14371.1 hypothetical protein [Maritimibacter harenae]